MLFETLFTEGVPAGKYQGLLVVVVIGCLAMSTGDIPLDAHNLTHDDGVL
jgi:hypothetical protein